MAAKKNRVGFLHSLRTQLSIGAMLLLGVTVSAISYALIVNQETTLTQEMEKTIILQGRNVALSSEKALLRVDPEFELFPLVKRIVDQNVQVVTVTIVDAEGLIQGDRDIVNVSKEYRPDLTGRALVASGLLHPGEQLYDSEETYLFRTPVVSSGKPIGSVFVEYSKSGLKANIVRGIRITLTVTGASLIIGLVLALIFFRHISRPMQVMLDGVGTLAAGNLDTQIEMPTRNEFHILAQSFNEMAFRIAAAQKEHIVKERMDRELEIARDIQHTLLPENVYVPTGLEIGHHYNSAMEVGGDYLDIIPVGDDKIGLVMADVSGKGVPGLVVMAMVKIMVQDLVGKDVPPKEIVRKLNAALLGNIRRNMFVTFFVAVLDLRTGRVIFSNAGHNPLVIYNARQDHARFFKMAGPPMGAFPDSLYAGHLEQYRLDLSGGDLLLQFTDGLNESKNEAGEFFTMKRILDVARDTARDGAQAVVSKLVQAEIAFRGRAPQADDITLLAVSLDAAQRENDRGSRIVSNVDADS